MEEERLFPIDIHYNKLLGKGSTSTLIITQLDLSVLLQRGDSLNIHAHVMRMLTWYLYASREYACRSDIKGQG